MMSKPEPLSESRRRPLAVLPSEALRVLVIDDEVLIGRALKRMLNKYEVVCVLHPSEAFELLAQRAFDVILCDVMMPEVSGKDVYDVIRRDFPGMEQHIIFMTGAVLARAAEFLDGVTNDRMEKPFERQTLFELISKHLPK